MCRKTKPGRFFLTSISLFFLIQIWLMSCSNLSNQSTSVLLFERRTQQTRQIYRVNPDGSQLELITEFPLGVLYWLSPMGDSLAVLTPQATGLPGPSPGILTLYDTATGEPFQTLEEIGQSWSEHIPWQENVVWSPQGDSLAFLRSSESGNGVDIFLYDLGAKEVMTLTNEETIKRSVAWSPDGTQMAYAFRRPCRQSNCLPEEMYWNIAIMDRNGTDQHIVTNFYDSGFLPADLWISSLCNLTWSSDATTIAFVNECGELMAPYYWREVFMVSVDGPGLWQLTAFTDLHDVMNLETLPLNVFMYSLHWSTDSNLLFIGYTNASTAPDGQPQGGILVATKNAELSTYLPVADSVIGSSTSWSLDNKYLAWHTESINLERRSVPGPPVFGKVENDRVLILNGQEELPIGPCARRGIYWSLDSNFAAYVANKSGVSCGDAEVDQSIAIVSLPDLIVTQMAESLEGDIRLIGWIFEFKK